MADSESTRPATSRPKKYSSGPLKVIVGVMIATALGVAVTGGFFVHHTRQELSQNFLEDATSLAAKEFQERVGRVESQLTKIQEWAQDGSLTSDLSDTQSMNTKLVQVLDLNDQFYGIVVGNSNKQAYYLTRDGDQWRTRYTDSNHQPGKALFQTWKTAAEPIGSPVEESLDYDPTERPWWKEAVKNSIDDPCLTIPYPFISSKKWGVTSAVQLPFNPSASGETTYVVGIDVPVDTIFKKLTTIRHDTHGKVFLFDENDRVFQPGVNAQGEPETYVDVKQVKDPIVADAMRKIAKDQDRGDKVVAFTSNDERYWSGANPLDLGEDWKVWIGIVMPESDFIKESDRSSYIAVIVSLIILLSGVVVSVIVLRRYSKQFRDQPHPVFDTDDYETHLLGLIATGEGDRVEFKSTVRMNLRSEKFGKEIEIAWLKTVAAFMNSEGGTLVIGVDDDGAILGLESDNFENEDKCKLHIKNVFNQHIGAEYSASIRYDVKRVQGKDIVIIACTPSEKPVFVINKNEEAFYIRSGPSSVQLSMSKALEYIEQRR